MLLDAGYEYKGKNGYDEDSYFLGEEIEIGLLKDEAYNAFMIYVYSHKVYVMPTKTTWEQHDVKYNTNVKSELDNLIGDANLLPCYDFEKQYNIHDMYSGTFYNFKTEEEKWAYWARMIKCNTYDTKPTPVYQKLLKLIEHKKYFIITTNADNQFNINGFDMQKYFEVQGNYIYLQCKNGCHDKVYYNHQLIDSMVHQTKNCKIPVTLVPVCPVCNGKMDIHVHKDQYFVTTKTWYKQNHDYNQFLKNALEHNVVFLELGVGFNTPGIIRYPFEKIVYQYKNAHLIRFNKDFPQPMPGNETNVISFDEDIEYILSLLLNNDITHLPNCNINDKQNLFNFGK